MRSSQFGQPLADFELVQDKIGWMVAHLFGLESMCYLTCGLVDAGVPDYSLESAICKVSGTEFLWYAANRAVEASPRHWRSIRRPTRSGHPAGGSSGRAEAVPARSQRSRKTGRRS